MSKRDYTWRRKDDAFSEMELRNLKGKGFKSPADQLEEIAYRSVYQNGFLAAANYIRQLEQENHDLKEKVWILTPGHKGK